MEPHYFSTLIAIAPDSPAVGATVPVARNGKPTVATIQFDLLDGHGFEYTQPDVLFASWLRRQDGYQTWSAEIVAGARATLFSRSQACLRASPLPKSHGWGLRFNEQGRVALVAVDSQEYAALINDVNGSVTVIPAMRSRRA